MITGLIFNPATWLMVGISVATLTWLYRDMARQKQWKADKMNEIEQKRARLERRENTEKDRS